jgi:phosphatidylglycerol:prolipoprotein diacylglycerol transferase
MYEILFQYGSITLTTFNLLLVVGFLAGTTFLVRFIQLKKLNLNFFVNHFIYFIFLPLLGGRIFYIFEHINLFKKAPFSSLYVWDLGFSAFGIFYTAILVVYLFSRANSEDFWGWVDALTLSSLFGLFIIHIGHFFNGSHYGIPTELPWGIAFDTVNIPYLNPIHPTQLYSALIALIVLYISMKYAKRTHLTGIVGTFAIMLYSISAFGINFLQGNASTYAKINFLIIAALAFIFYIHCSHKKLYD